MLGGDLAAFLRKESLATGLSSETHSHRLEVGRGIPTPWRSQGEHAVTLGVLLSTLEVGGEIVFIFFFLVPSPNSLSRGSGLGPSSEGKA